MDKENCTCISILKVCWCCVPKIIKINQCLSKLCSLPKLARFEIQCRPHCSDLLSCVGSNATGVNGVVRHGNRYTMEKDTRSSAVAERPRDASCLSVVSFDIPTAQFFKITSYCGFRFTSAWNSIKFCYTVSYCLRRRPTKTPKTNTPRS